MLGGVLVGAGEPPPQESPDARSTTRTASIMRLNCVPFPFLRMSRKSTIPGSSKPNAYKLEGAKGEGAREALAAVVVTLTWIGGTPDAVANAVCGEKVQAAPMGKLAQENEKVWFSAALSGTKARANEAV